MFVKEHRFFILSKFKEGMRTLKEMADQQV